MSIEAINWVLTKADIPEGDGASSLTLVLIGLANHAHADGRHAFPSIATLMQYSRLSRSTVIRCLAKLKECGLITEGNQAIAAAHIERADQRPTVYDLQIERGVVVTRRAERGVTEAPNGVSSRRERGVMVTPEPSLKPKNKPTTPVADAPEQIPLPLPVPADPEKDAEDERGPKPLTLNQRATQAAQWYYRRLGNMGNVPAMMKIIRKAMVNGHSNTQIKTALTFIADHHWTLTEERLAHALQGGPRPVSGQSNGNGRRKVYQLNPDGTSSGREIQVDW